MPVNDLALKLKAALKSALPGTQVQWMMASSDRLVKDFPTVPGKDARPAGVLILLWYQNGTVHTVFMQRPDYTGFHGGQISFPGGKKEPGDSDIISTAFREAREETGLIDESIETIGTLTPLFIPVSSMVVTACVAFSDKIPLFKPDPKEVDHLIVADLNLFLDRAIVRTKPMELRGEVYDIRYFAYQDYIIWGATAMMLNELLEIIRRDNLSLIVQ